MKTRLLLCLLIFVHCTAAAENALPALASGYRPLDYAAPTPASYQLPVLGSAANGSVIDSHGNHLQLHELMKGKLNVLSFIYSSCNDVNGCPLATTVLQKIKLGLQKEPKLAQQVRLLTLSFNPEQDNPEKMQQFGKAFQSKGIDWLFLTTASEKQLQPILNGYQQHIQKIVDANGQFTGTFTHDLRVYLIDEQLQIRNIYSVAFLHADILISDLKTLLANSSGTFHANYQQALAERQGTSSNLLKTVMQPPLGLPVLPVPKDNPVTTAKVKLGRKLFYDRRLSFNNTFSCALCHIPEQGFTNHEMATAVGVEGRTVRRNSPTLFNIGYAERLFHDGRENSLEQQVWGPLLAHNEMANPSIGFVLDKIKQQPDYQGLFQQAFGKPASMETVGMALASYQRTLNAANSPFDRWYYGHQKQAINVKAQQGFKLFAGKAGCVQCHQLSEKYTLFTDQTFHNTGIGYAETMSSSAKGQRVELIPGVYANLNANQINSVSEKKTNDLGRYEITQNPADRWRYKTPTLRNIQLTAPYMHNGSLKDLRQVVEFYNQGGFANENLDSLIKPLNLSAQEIDELTEFLSTLTGDNIKTLVDDAFAVPIGEMK